MMRSVTSFSIAAVTMLSAAAMSHAETIYNFNGTANAQRAQAGFNNLYIGDDVTPAAGTFKLNTVTLQFGLLKYDDGHYGSGNVNNYTPTIDLIIFAIDPATRLPTSATPLATATVSDQTFTPSVVPFAQSDQGDPQFYSSANLKNVTFDFSSQNLTLPANFGFAYRVPTGVAADGNINDEQNFFLSLASKNDVPATVGSTGYGMLVSYPNVGTYDPSHFAYDGNPPANDASGGNYSVDSNLLATVTGTAVPEPGSLALLGLGMTFIASRRRR